MNVRIVKRIMAWFLTAALLVGAVPLAGGFALAAETETLHLAAYAGTVPQVEGVTWDSDVGAADFTKYYETVSVRGEKPDGTAVQAAVEVIPPDTVYFVDAGVSGRSDPFDALAAMPGGRLQNGVPEQPKSDGDWGYETGGPGGSNYYTKSGMDGSNKDLTGVINDKNQAGTYIDYYFPLEAGTYTVTSSHYEWWSGPRTMDISARTEDGTDIGGITGSVTVSSGSRNSRLTNTFTLAQAATVIYRVTASGAQAPTLSWIMISQGQLPKITVAFDQALQKSADILDEADLYGARSVKALQRLYGQYSAWDPEGGTQAEIDAAADALSNALKGLVKKQEQIPYESAPIGERWNDTDGLDIQAHGGGFLEMEDLQGPIYYWVGEDKSHGDSNFSNINLYSSRDLLNWTFIENLLVKDMDIPGLHDNKIERPKLIYNSKTGKYVLYGHWEDHTGYSSSQICVATADAVEGPYTYLGHWRVGAQQDATVSVDGTEVSAVNWRWRDGNLYTDDADAPGGLRLFVPAADTALRDAFLSDPKVGTGSRDFTVFVDNKGTAEETAYILSAEDHENMRIYRLSDDFTDVQRDENGDPVTEPLFTGGHREAPAITKIQHAGQNYYFMISSGQSGWEPNQTRWSWTTDLMDRDSWQEADNGMPFGFIGNNTSFFSQPTNIAQIGDKFLYMGDRWYRDGLEESCYVWLPLEITLSAGEITKDNPPSMAMNYNPLWKLSENKLSYTDSDSLLLSTKEKNADVHVTASQPGADDDTRALWRINDGDYTRSKNGGDDDHYYKPANGTTPYDVTVDLGKAAEVSRVDITFNQWNGSEPFHLYSIEGSADGSGWEPLYTTGTDRQYGLSANKLIAFRSHDVTGSYRYIRLTVHGAYNSQNDNPADWATGINELQVFGRMEEPEDPQAEKELLKTAMEAARVYDAADYTTDSYASLKSALENAETVYGDGAADVTQIRAAVTLLETAGKQLVRAGSAEALKSFAEFIWTQYRDREDFYSAKSWATFKNAVEDAVSLADSSGGNLSEQAHQNAVDAIYAALDSLVPQDRSSLRDWVVIAEAALAEAEREGNYFKDSLQNLRDTLAGAEALLESDTASQEELDGMVSKLQGAVEDLLQYGSNRNLQFLVQTAERLQEKHYTQSSWTGFAKALTAARTVLQGEQTQEVIDKAYQSLLTAMNALSLRANTAELEKSILQAESILKNKDLYAPESIAGLAAVLEQAKSVLQNPDAAQAQVNTMRKTLNDEIGKARLRAKKDRLRAAVTLLQGISLGGCSEAMTENVRDALADAQALLLDENTPQETVDRMEEKLDAYVYSLQTGLPVLNRADKKAYIAGYDDGTVRPNAPITRQEMAQLLYNRLSEISLSQFGTTSNSFPDVTAANWGNTAISTLAKAGVIGGYGDGSFKPEKEITRAELVSMVTRFCDLTDFQPEGGLFPDAKGHWAQKEIAYAAENGWIRGYENGSFRPDQNITRAEAVTVVNAILGRTAEDFEKIEDMKTFRDNLNEKQWYYKALQIAANNCDG